MRDDVLELYTALRDQLKIKLSLLDCLYTGELEKINLIKTGAYQEAEEVFIDDGEILAKILSSDFEITRIKDTICRARGFDKNKFSMLLRTETHPLIKESASIEEDINKIINRLLEEKEGLIADLKDEMEEVKKNINTLSDITRIKKYMN